MKKLSVLILLAVLLNFSKNGYSQDQPAEITYKTIEFSLHLEVLYPKKYSKKNKLPAVIFYHGGGWRSGNKAIFRRQAEYFNSRGIIGILVEYRTESKHGTNPFEAVKDARSAMRYIKINANKLGIDKNKIIASGGSAGGHLAVSLALLDSINDTNDKLNIDPTPYALFLFNPVLDTGPKGFGFSKFGKKNYKKISPIEHIKANTPPTLIMVGTKDKVLPTNTAKLYKQRMESHNNRCDLVLYPDQEHAFFNWNKQEDHKYFLETLIEADKFLVSLNILKGKENVREFFKE